MLEVAVKRVQSAWRIFIWTVAIAMLLLFGYWLVQVGVAMVTPHASGCPGCTPPRVLPTVNPTDRP